MAPPVGFTGSLGVSFDKMSARYEDPRLAFSWISNRSPSHARASLSENNGTRLSSLWAENDFERVVKSRVNPTQVVSFLGIPSEVLEIIYLGRGRQRGRKICQVATELSELTLSF